MEISKVTRVESGAQLDKVAGYLPKAAVPNVPGMPGAVVTGGKVEVVGKESGTSEHSIALPDIVKGENGQMSETYAKIRYNPDSHVISIEIHDAQTDKVIRQIPPEEIAKLAKSSGLQTGVLVEKKR